MVHSVTELAHVVGVVLWEGQGVWSVHKQDTVQCLSRLTGFK